MQFGDREIMSDLLMDTKYISANYHRAVLESTNDKIRDTLIQLNNEEINLQKQIFNLMLDRNWYETRRANTSNSAVGPDEKDMFINKVQQQISY